MNITKRQQIHIYKEQTSGYQQEEEKEKGQDSSKGLRGTKYHIENK